MSLPTESPIASFLARKQPWVDEALCIGLSDVFLADDYDVDECRSWCALCPVRVECGDQAMLEEGGTDQRWFVRAYMTPEQRVSIHRRGGLKGRDPMALVMGQDEGRAVPPVPDEGDRWSKHLTTLSRKLVREVLLGMERGQHLPPSVPLCEMLQCNPAPLARVLEALVQDGTLDLSGIGFRYRGGASVLGDWLPIHLRDS